MTRDRRRTFGTVRQLRSGRWQPRYMEDGRQIGIGETFASEKEANAALSRVEADLERGTHVSPRRSNGRFGAFGERYMAEKTDWSATTRQNRESLWRLHLEPTFGHLAFAQITTSRVRSWHAGLHKAHAATSEDAYRLLRQILNAAVDDRRLPANPCRVKGAGVDRSPERSTATVAELEAIVAELPERMRLFALLAVWAGLRRSELQGLRRRDLNVAQRTVAVAQTVHHLRGGLGVVVQGPKSDAGRRSVSFPSSIVAEVEEHLARFVGHGRDDLVFVGEKGGPLRPHVFGAAFRRARGLAGRSELTFHDLRHTANTLAAATGATLPELMHRMGHATPHSAIRYLHATADRDQVIAEALAELRPSAPVIALDSARNGSTAGK